MNMKKVFMILIAFALVFTMTGAVSADEFTQISEEDKQTIVNYTSDTTPGTYTIEIPAEITLKPFSDFSLDEDLYYVNYDEENDEYCSEGTSYSYTFAGVGYVNVTDLGLSNASVCLYVNVTSENDFHLVQDGKRVIEYEFQYHPPFTSLVSLENAYSEFSSKFGEIITIYPVEDGTYTGGGDYGANDLPLSCKITIGIWLSDIVAGNYQDTLTFEVGERLYSPEELNKIYNYFNPDHDDSGKVEEGGDSEEGSEEPTE